MTIDLNKYTFNKEFIQKYYLTNKGQDISISISILACATGCPCIVVAYWLGEISDWHPDAIRSIKSLSTFYRYDSVLNIPENIPFDLKFYEKK